MVVREIFEKCTVARLGVPYDLTRHGQNGQWHAIRLHIEALPIRTVLSYLFQIQLVER